MSRPHTSHYAAPLTPPVATSTHAGVTFPAERVTWDVLAYAHGLIHVETTLWAGRADLRAFDGREGSAHPPTDDRPWWLIEWAGPQPPQHFTQHVQAMLADALPGVTA